MLCKGDGLCNSKCPTGAIFLKHFTDEELVSQVDAAVPEEEILQQIDAAVAQSFHELHSAQYAVFSDKRPSVSAVS